MHIRRHLVNTRIVLRSISGNRFPDFCPAATLELRDPWWQAFLSYASQVLASRLCRSFGLFFFPGKYGSENHDSLLTLLDGTAQLIPSAESGDMTRIRLLRSTHTLRMFC
jgi:hypothetical protein